MFVRRRSRSLSCAERVPSGSPRRALGQRRTFPPSRGLTDPPLDDVLGILDALIVRNRHFPAAARLLCETARGRAAGRMYTVRVAGHGHTLGNIISERGMQTTNTAYKVPHPLSENVEFVVEAPSGAAALGVIAKAARQMQSEVDTLMRCLPATDAEAATSAAREARRGIDPRVSVAARSCSGP